MIHQDLLEESEKLLKHTTNVQLVDIWNRIFPEEILSKEEVDKDCAEDFIDVVIEQIHLSPSDSIIVYSMLIDEDMEDMDLDHTYEYEDIEE